MTFFQTDIDPILLRQKHQDILPMTYNASMQAQQQQSSLSTNPPAIVTKLFQHLFKGSTNKTDTRITSDPMNRLVSFHFNAFERALKVDILRTRAYIKQETEDSTVVYVTLPFVVEPVSLTMNFTPIKLKRYPLSI
ncbi:hypothetical protein INT48_003922 [Thamnidium elegans]|uniref:Uncharacterized protein n=1 Tax=Thamnidium elegans TaxID=101142 RepID=A0A8H7ST14_9FUNG|nr:hypothetical protein INT48_003922 [Thamnidium elegans]